MRPASILLLVLLALALALGWFVARGERAEMEPAEPDVAQIADAPRAATATNRVERVELEPALVVVTEEVPEPAPKEPGPCRVRVIDALTSLPVAGASVFLLAETPLAKLFQLSKDFDAPEDPSEALEVGLTDAEGIVVVEPGPPGDWIWASEGERVGAVARSIEAQERTLVLHVPEMLELEVHDAAGAPAAGARVLELGARADFLTDAAGRVALPLVPFPTEGSESTLDFVLPLVDTTPRRHTLQLGSKRRSPLKFTLGPSGTLELVATSNGRPVAVEGLSIRWGCLVPDGDGFEMTWLWEEPTSTGSVLVPHVGVGRELWGRAFHRTLVFPRTELAPIERAGDVALRTIPLERGLVHFRGIAVDSNGAPMPGLHVVVGTHGTYTRDSQPARLRSAGQTGPSGEFDVVEKWSEDVEHREWEPGATFDLDIFTDAFDVLTTTVETPPWTFDRGLAPARLLDFGTVVFRRTRAEPERR